MVKNPLANAGDMSSIPGLGRSPGGRNDNPLQYSCLGNPMDRGAWQLQSMESQNSVQPSDQAHVHYCEVSPLLALVTQKLN